MARPKKENPKDIQYRVRLDAETAAELESLRKQSGMCKAWIIRELIHRAYKLSILKTGFIESFRDSLLARNKEE